MMRKTIILSCLTLLLAATLVSAQTGEEIAAALSAEATEAYGQGDYATFVRNFEELARIAPQQPQIRYNLACGYALLGEKEKAIEQLEVLLEHKADFGIARDPDLESLHGHPRFEEIVAEFARIFSPILHSQRAFTVDIPDLLPEGFAYDSSTNRFFFGSMRHGTIYVLARDGKYRQFAALPAGDGMSVLGLEVDRKRNVVWACGMAINLARNFNSDDQGTTGLFGFDLQSGELKHQYMLEGKHPVAGFNDVTVASNGDIYLTGGPLYRVVAGSDKPEPFLHDQVNGSNGITFGPDDGTLFVGSMTGLIAIDMKSGKATPLTAPEGVKTSGMDGLYYTNGSLVGIQHTLGPTQAVRFRLNDDHTAITSRTIIERNNPEFVTAMTGAIVGSEFYYVARGPIPRELPDDIAPQDRLFLGNTQIWKVSLESL